MNPTNMNQLVTCDAVDRSVLISLGGLQAEGEPDLIVSLIDLYLEETSGRLAAMSSRFEERDFLSLRREAHCLKGSSATLGAEGLAGLCDVIETRADGPPEMVGRLLIELRREFLRVREAFSVERQKRTLRASEPCAENEQ